VQAVLMMPVPPRKRTFIGQVLFSNIARLRSHYNIGIISVLIKSERTFVIAA
jgi:hypothetical protein